MILVDKIRTFTILWIFIAFCNGRKPERLKVRTLLGDDRGGVVTEDETPGGEGGDAGDPLETSAEEDMTSLGEENNDLLDDLTQYEEDYGSPDPDETVHPDPAEEAAEGLLLNWVENEVEDSVKSDLDKNQAFLDRIPDIYDVVYPVQVRRNEVLPVDTRDKDKPKAPHYHHTGFLLTMFGKKLRIKLSLNRELMSRGLRQKRNIDAKTQIIEESMTENCYYQGYVRKLPDSQVVVSTCNGISGIIRLDANTTYIIRPLQIGQQSNETRFPHVVYRSLPAKKDLTCANERGIWQSFRELHIGEFMRTLKIMKATQNEFDTVTALKQVELALVCDHALYQRFNESFNDVLEYLLQTANMIDAVYKEDNIRINLVIVEIWNVHDMVVMEPNARAMLHSFLQYRQETLDMFQPDMTLFLVGQEFQDDEVGMAVPDSVCSQRAVAVVQDPSDLDPTLATSALCHMIGHVLGIDHQHGDVCDCPYPGGCLMNRQPVLPGRIQPRHLSSCSRDALHEAVTAGLATCLVGNPPKTLSYNQNQASYHQECGNGVVDRGEECDCMSVQECMLKDPCCDPKTCMLRPWATCRFGDCCSNCTVMSNRHMCRLPLTECDVPEFCDGVDGMCPTNALVQDGWPCRDGESYCYHGTCHTYGDQCQLIWGAGAGPGDAKCFETFNTAGRFDGHCGKNRTDDTYVKCEPHHVMCGLLHCAGGEPEPRVGKDKTFSTTTVVSDGNNYECKIISSEASRFLPHFGMVQDGTRCDEGAICVRSQCVPVSQLSSFRCPTGLNNLTCSGRGICTTEFQCFCHANYTGATCSEINKYPYYNLMPSTPPPVLMYDVTVSTTTDAAAHVTMAFSTTEGGTEVIMKPTSGFSTWWLIIVVVLVAVGASILLGCCLVCYRRRSPIKRKRGKKGKKNPSVFGSIMSLSSSNSKSSRSRDGSVADNANRIISFGQMPSYRADKIRKFRKAMGAATHSDGESEHSRSERDSAEVKVAHTLPLSRAPEKGILKKYPRSADDLLGETRASPGRRPSAPTGGVHMLEMLPLRTSGGRPISAENGELEHMLTQQQQQQQPHSPHEYEDINEYVSEPEWEGEEDGDECDSCCSSIEKKDEDFLTPSDLDDLEARDQETQTDPDEATGGGSGTGSVGSPVELPRDVSCDSLEGAKNKIIKLKNINDLLKQIDEQFNSVLRQTTQGDASPSNQSEDMPCSETEADRQFPRNSFYKQSDIEEGYSPPHRSPVLSPNPSTQRSSTRYSSNLSSGSPEPLPSPGGVLSPIQSRSPPQLSSPVEGPSPLGRGGNAGAYPRRQATSTPIQHPQPSYRQVASPLRPQPVPAPRSPRWDRRRQPSPAATAAVPVAAPRDPTRAGDGHKTTVDGHPPGGPPSASKNPAGRNSPPRGQPSPAGPPKPRTNVPPDSSPASSSNVNNSNINPQREPLMGVGATPKTQVEPPPANAVPYRGAKTGGSGGSGSIPGSPTPSVRQRPPAESRSAGSGQSTLDPPARPADSKTPSPRGKKSGPSPFGSTTPSPSKSRPKSPTSLLQKFTLPLFEGSPFRRRGPSPNDAHSTSEGYHSDRADPEEAIIIREIPGKKPADLAFLPNPNGAYTRAPGSPGSPEDINV